MGVRGTDDVVRSGGVGGPLLLESAEKKKNRVALMSSHTQGRHSFEGYCLIKGESEEIPNVLNKRGKIHTSYSKLLTTQGHFKLTPV